jgi:hypothetical protein
MSSSSEGSVNITTEIRTGNASIKKQTLGIEKLT